jgi:hypothetical protein
VERGAWTTGRGPPGVVHIASTSRPHWAVTISCEAPKSNGEAEKQKAESLFLLYLSLIGI